MNQTRLALRFSNTDIFQPLHRYCGLGPHTCTTHTSPQPSWAKTSWGIRTNEKNCGRFCWRAGPKPKWGLKPRPTPSLFIHIPEATSQHREALLWGNIERIGRKRPKACNSYVPAESDQDKENWKKNGKGTDEPELTMYAVLCAGQLPINCNPITLLPTSHIPPQSILIRANPGGGDNWFLYFDHLLLTLGYFKEDLFVNYICSQGAWLFCPKN